MGVSIFHRKEAATLQEQPAGTVVIVPPKEPETPEHLLMRIFGKTADELVEDLIYRFSQGDTKP